VLHGGFINKPKHVARCRQ